MIIKCCDCGKDTNKFAECFICHKLLCATCFLDERHNHEDGFVIEIPPERLEILYD